MRVPSPWVALPFVGVAVATLGATALWVAIGAPALLALLHALAVGVFLTVAMGLLYQFVPVVAMATLRWPALARVHLVLAVVGTACLVGGFQTGNFHLVAAGGLFHLTGVCLQAMVLGRTVIGSRPPAPAAGAVLALPLLLLTMVAGVWLASSLAGGVAIGWLAGDHALLGLAGFFGTLITAVTLRLLRMFERINVEARTPALAIGAAAACAIAIAFARIGAYALIVAALAVCANVFAIARVRNPAYQRETLLYSAASALGALGAAVADAFGASSLAIACVLWFFVGLAVAGYLQRIVPFIWWIRRSRAEGTRNIPDLGTMNDTRLGYAIWIGWVAAGLLWVGGHERWAGALAFVAWLLLVAQLARPFYVRKAAGSKEG